MVIQNLGCNGKVFEVFVEGFETGNDHIEGRECFAAACLCR